VDIFVTYKTITKTWRNNDSNNSY